MKNKSLEILKHSMEYYAAVENLKEKSQSEHRQLYSGFFESNQEIKNLDPFIDKLYEIFSEMLDLGYSELEILEFITAASAMNIHHVRQLQAFKKAEKRK